VTGAWALAFGAMGDFTRRLCRGCLDAGPAVHGSSRAQHGGHGRDELRRKESVLYCGKPKRHKHNVLGDIRAHTLLTLCLATARTISAQHMAKGSQLSQLKSALSQAGLSKQSQPGRKRRRAQNEEKDNAKRAARLREIQQKLNPFDVKVTKLKHDVGGRKLRGVSGKPAQSKQAGIEAVSQLMPSRRRARISIFLVIAEANSSQRVRREGPCRRNR
jgi:hypothetical protein